MKGRYNRKDHFYERAKSEGYRSRAAYKLKELDAKFNLLTPNAKILDLGCWPGGWLQVAAEKVKPPGCIVGIDLKASDPIDKPGVVLLQGDVRDAAIQAMARMHAPEGFDLVLSDMSPHLTGIKEVDSAAVEGVVELALSVAQTMLRPQGKFVCKVFKSGNIEQIIKSLRSCFSKVIREELDATRSTSNEFYVVAIGKR
ncbi:MAG: RlmE family RNA methyltransferase [Bdellovibrionota bacterium]|nr:MAG: RlmE family RNA methyltransferase [Bdellovibrionota bacterium]